jgi:hypothetical protein
MSGISITIDGLDEWRDIVDPARFSKEMDAAVQRATEMLRDEAKKMPPRLGRHHWVRNPLGCPWTMGGCACRSRSAGSG